MAFLKIKPLDTLFFRGGKPFNAGSNSWSDSEFLPNPSVIWGAMFSVLLKEGKVKIADKKLLTIKNIYLYKIENKVMNFLVPTPLDVYIDEYNNNYISKVQKINNSFLSNYPLEYISVIEKDNLDVADKSFIDMDSLFLDYQVNDKVSLYPFNELFKQDYKIGIKLNKQSKTAQENHLYRIDLTQFEEEEESGFVVEYELREKKSFEDKGILKLGGEGKMAQFEILKDNDLVDLESYQNKALLKITEKGYFKLYFKTPVYLKNSWQPNEIEGLKLLSANVGKYIPIGGWDMKINEPKEMKKFIPAGSVYVYKIEDKSIDFKKMIENEIEFDETYKGFGLFELLSVKEKING